MRTTIRYVTRAIDSLFRHSGVLMPHRPRQRLVFLTISILLYGSFVLRRMASTQAYLTPQTTCAASHECRLRRILNDPLLPWERSNAPVVRAQLRRSRAHRWIVLIDETAQAAHLRVWTSARWDRGRAIPRAWICWPGPTRPSVADWERWRHLRDPVGHVLPPNAAVVVVVDRAVGCSAFTDHVAAHGWDGVVRVQGQPHWQDRHGRIRPIRMPVRSPSERWKGAGQVLKAVGWRPARIVARWGTVQQQPLLVVSRLPVN